MKTAHNLMIIIVMLGMISCANPDYDKAVDAASWQYLKDGERIGWYLRADKRIYGSDMEGVECCVKYADPMMFVDAATFQASEDCEYAKDKNNVYYPLRVICEDVMYNENGCVEDCYIKESIIVGAEGRSFRYIGDGYGVDRRHMYYNGVRIPWNSDILDREKRKKIIESRCKDILAFPPSEQAADTIPAENEDYSS